jgi:hypothetical protein
MVGEGETIPEAAKELWISEQTRRPPAGGESVPSLARSVRRAKADDAKRLQALEHENATSKGNRRRSRSAAMQR